jgi:hypothetical protein
MGVIPHGPKAVVTVICENGNRHCDVKRVPDMTSNDVVVFDHGGGMVYAVHPTSIGIGQTGAPILGITINGKTVFKAQ